MIGEIINSWFYPKVKVNYPTEVAVTIAFAVGSLAMRHDDMLIPSSLSYNLHT